MINFKIKMQKNKLGIKYTLYDKIYFSKDKLIFSSKKNKMFFCD